MAMHLIFSCDHLLSKKSMSLSGLMESVLEVDHPNFHILLECIVHLAQSMPVVLLEHALDAHWHVARDTEILYALIDVLQASNTRAALVT